MAMPDMLRRRCRRFWRASRPAKPGPRPPASRTNWCATSNAACRCCRRPERHANFTVLHAAGIPSVLIEMGFLSNADDEAALNDPAHRALIARAMTRAVDAWFTAPREEGFL